MNLRLLLLTLCLSASASVYSEVLPRVGDNQTHPTLLFAGETQSPVQRNRPAIADLKVPGPTPSTRTFAVAWLEERIGSDPQNPFLGFTNVLVAIIDGDRNLVVPPQVVASYSSQFTHSPSTPTIVADESDYFSVIWSITTPGGLTQDESDNEISRQRIISRTFRKTPPSAALCQVDGLPLPDPSTANADPFDDEGVLFDTALIPELNEDAGLFSLHDDAGIRLDAVADASGRVRIVFPDHRAEPQWGIYVVRGLLETFADPQQSACPDGQPGSPEAAAYLIASPIATRVAGNGAYRVEPRIASGFNGDTSLVTWRTHRGAIEAQLLNLDGDLVGPRIVVAPAPISTQESLHAPDVGAEANGVFRVVWSRHRYRDAQNDTDARSDILMSRFDSNGNALDAGQVISLDAASDPTRMLPKRAPTVSDDDIDGDFAIAWAQEPSECPTINAQFEWQIRASCGTLPLTASSCDVEIATAEDVPRMCWRGLRLRPHPATGTTDWVSFRADQPREWPTVFSANSITVDVDRTTETTLNRCVFVESQGQEQPLRLTLEQECSTAGSCETCEEQLAARGLSMPEDTMPLPAANAPSAPVRGATAPTVHLRWLPRDYQSPESTALNPTRISAEGQGVRAESAAIGLLREGEILAAWMADNVVTTQGTRPESLVTQNLTGPVEFRINDVAILEGPAGRATASFTVTADKVYPGSDCILGPSVEGLTFDGSARSIDGDYARTELLLNFGNPCQNQVLTRSFSVPITDDDLYEGNETFTVELFGETSAIVRRRTGIGVILENDLPSLVEIRTPVVEICENGELPLVDPPPGTSRCSTDPGPARVDLVVNLENDRAQAVEGSVRFQTEDGSAASTPGGDFIATNGELGFLPGVTEVLLSIDLVDDGLRELDEQFFVVLSGPQELRLPEELEDRRFIVNVIDNDLCATPPELLLPDPADPDGRPAVLAASGPDADRTGFFCIRNPEGFGVCPWETRLDLGPGQAPWLTLDGVDFADPSADPDLVSAAQAACAAYAGDPAVQSTGGAIRYVALENLPPPGGSQAQQRDLVVQLLNGATVPDWFEVVQEGGDCRPNLVPAFADFFPIGGRRTIEADFNDQSACESFGWTVSIAQDSRAWLSLVGANAAGEIELDGAGSFQIDVEPNLQPMPGSPGFRLGTVRAGGTDLQVTQEDPFFDHFDDGVPPDPAGWDYTEVDAWSEAGTWLTASTMSTAEAIAARAFAGCSICRVESTVRFDAFGKGRGTIYLWWRSGQDYLALTVDEFFDSWTLTQRVGGTDYVLREFDRDVLVGPEYDVVIDVVEILGQTLITVGIDGAPMCALPGPGAVTCSPASPAGTPVIGSGTVGLAVDDATISFNLLRVVRSDELEVPLGVIFSNGFE
ncbi:Calx-beta domain-containing protein [Halomonas denitrificans]|nr:hypothetical protein [Halomonas denitrificans]